jgi:mannose-6-phosphate isomerase-like protein (cupin superfamily)
MKFSLTLAVFLALGVLLNAQGGGASGVIQIDHDKVATAISKGGNLVTAPDLLVLGSHREGKGNVEIHTKETDVFYVIEGEGSILIGGTALDQKETRPGQLTGSDIKGGQTYHLTKGDVLVIPAGVPHWVKDVPGGVFNYFVVKVIKQ